MLQTDARWADTPLGILTTIGKEGCLLVCVCIANTLLGNQITPDILAQQLAALEGLKPDGELLWTKLPQTASILWLHFPPSKPIEGMELVEYARPNDGSHFVLYYQGTEFDPKPETERFGVKSRRQLALINQPT